MKTILITALALVAVGGAPEDSVVAIKGATPPAKGVASW